MHCVSSLLLLSTLFGTAIGCLPGLGLGGGGGGGCCSPAQPSCGSPCGGGGAPPSPVYAAAPLAPAPFAAYPQAPPPSPPGPFPALGGGFPQQPLTVQSGYVASGGNFQTGSVQGGQVQAGGAYLADPVHQVQPLPLLGQPVAYEKTVVTAPVQQSLSTSQVLTKVMPASAVLDEQVIEPAAASSNNIVSSIQTGYGDEQQQTQVFHAQPAGHASSSSSSSSSSSASSSSASAEHHATHQVRVPSASSSVEANERVVPDVVVQRIIETFESTPFPQQVALQTAAPFVPAQQHVVAPQVAPTVHQTVQPIQTIQPIHPAPVQPIHPAPVQQVPLQPAQHIPVAVVTQTPSHFVSETKVVAEEDRIEAPSGSDYDQPTDIATNEQATVNELLATLDTATSTVASNLDFNQVTVEPNQNQESAIIQTEGDDYDAPLNEDRKDVPTAEPSRNVVPSVSEPVAMVPEESAPIIPQPIQPIQPVQTYQPSVTSAPVVESTIGYVQPEPTRPQVHLQPLAPAVRVEATTVAVTEPALTPAFELPIEVHEVVTPQVPLQPEPAIIQTITEQPIAEVTVDVLPTSAAPVSQFFENITSKEEKEDPAPIPSQPEPVSASVAPSISGNDYDEEKSIENKISTETDVVPNLGEYGSKFAKVQGAGTKQVSQPIEIETIENANPYGRKYWIF